MFKSKLIKKYFLVLIVIAALFFRVYGLSWDSGTHLHPDERFLSLVSEEISIPTNIFDYFNPSKSTLNPYNTKYKFFVYGSFPLTINKFFTVLFDFNNYDNFYLFGRFLSAFLDTLIVLLIYKVCEILEKNLNLSKRIKYYASFFYTVMVLPIQLSHFYTNDIFLNFFCFLSFYFAIKFYFYKKNKYLLYSALVFGFSIGTKINALLFVFLPLFFIIFDKKINLQKIKSVFLKTIIFIFVSYIGIRIADPKFFQNHNVFDLRINSIFLENLFELNSFNSSIFYPPGVQWINKPIWFPLVNMAFFGMGIFMFLLSLIGLWKFFKNKNIELKIIWIWFISIFIFLSFQHVKTLRYFIYLYPFLAIFTGFGFDFFHKFNMKYRMVLLFLILIWPISFLNIYTKPNPRVEASKWINDNFPNNSIILTEYWDDSLPLFVKDEKHFNNIQIPVFDKDTDEKWNNLISTFEIGDYLILSSNRGYGSILSASEQYPKMADFYQKLFLDKLNFKKIKEFNSYPTLNLFFTKIEFRDDWAEEAFTVYDHPKVLIFQKKL